MPIEPSLQQHRDFLKDTLRLQIDFSRTDQRRGVTPPPLQKPAGDGRRIDLTSPAQWDLPQRPLLEMIAQRRSRRRYLPHNLTRDELSALLWSTQGIVAQMNPATALRTVPSAGARHAFETYLCLFRVDEMEPGLYRYLPLEHQLELLEQPQDLPQKISGASLGQAFTGNAAVTFVWSAIPYRMEWRYGLAAHRVMGYDIGHVCQNLYLVAESLGLGTCAVAAFDQQQLDDLLNLDGQDEFAMYLASVGRV